MSPARARLLVAAAIGIGLVPRLAAIPAPGFVSDVGTFMAWASRLAESGPGAFYEPGYFADYPPGFLYLLWLVGSVASGEALRVAVKAISIPFDAGIAIVAYRIAAELAGRRAGVLAAGIWSLAPAPILAGTLWGQVDAVGTLVLLGALVSAGRGRWILAGALAGAAAMVKPQLGVGLVVVAAAALLELARGKPRPLLSLLAAGAAIVALGLPFGSGPVQLLALVTDAANTYPYTSLYAFNLWALVAGFWKPDAELFAVGAALLALGLLAACLPLRRARDVPALLAAGGLAAMAFYFLPTRAHERYLYPAFALLLPLAVARRGALAPYLALFLAFAATLEYAITRYPQNQMAAPPLLNDTLFSDAGVLVLTVLMIVSAAALVLAVVRGVRAAVLREPAVEAHAAGVPGGVPPALAPGGRPSRRVLVLALAVALGMLLTRGYRLDWPREMYFDEVYHARTAFELLAEREPYEWTHPHLAKEIMAVGILLFGDDRVTRRDDLRPVDGTLTAFAIGYDGARAYARDAVEVRTRDGTPLTLARLGEPVRALAFEGERLLALTDRRLVELPRDLAPGATPRSVALPAAIGPPVALDASAGRVAVAGAAGVAVFASPTLFEPTAPAVLLRQPAVAITSRPDGSELYVLAPQGGVHLVDPQSGAERRAFPTPAGRAMAYAPGPNRLFVARAGEATLDVIELEGGRGEAVPLANARTGALAEGATALALVPRTQFLYAVAQGRVVVVETHGASPFASLDAPGDLLAVDGTADELVVARADGEASVIETGRHALAWRLPGVLASALLAFFVVLLAARLFAARSVAVLAGLAVLLDGTMFAQPRIGMNDVYVALFIVAGWYFVVAAHAPRRSARADLLLAGLLFGLALASKWAGAYALAGVLIASLAVTAHAAWRERVGEGGPLDLLARRGLNAAWLFICFAILPAAVYLVSYLPLFGGPTIPFGWDLVELTRQMYLYHSGLTAPHPAGSPWWSWPLVLKPVYWYYGQSADGGSAVIYDTGNLALFWAGLPALVWLAVAAVRARSFRLGFPVFAFLTQYVAWIPITRVLFAYHFFTSLPFYLLALAAALGVLWERRERVPVLAALALATFVAVFFYPFVSGQPVPAAQASIFFVLPTWQYECQFYPAEGVGLQCPWALGAIDASAVLARIAFAAGVTVTLGAAALALRAGALRALTDRLRRGRASA